MPVYVTFYYMFHSVPNNISRISIICQITGTAYILYFEICALESNLKLFMATAKLAVQKV
jgi:hypothetical protein